MSKKPVPAPDPSPSLVPSAAPDLTSVEIETREGRRAGNQALFQHPIRRASMPSLFPRRSVNLMVGGIGSGKTTLALHEINRYVGTGRFLTSELPADREPDQCGAICCSGTLESLYDRILALDLDQISDLGLFPIRAWDPSPGEPSPAETLDRLYEELCRGARQEVHFLLIEGIQLMMEGKSTDPRAVRDFYSVLQRFCLDRDVTILGTVGTAKMKRGESYPILGDRCYGSMVWGQEASTLIGVEHLRLDLPEESRPPGRKVLIQVRESSEIVMLITTLRDGQMNLIEAGTGEGSDAETALDKLLDQQPGAAEFTMTDLIQWAAALNLSKRSLERWIESRADLGMIEKHGSTRNKTYRKPQVQ